MYLYEGQPLNTGAMSAVIYTPNLESLFQFQPKFGEIVDMSYRFGPMLMIPRGSAPVGEVDNRTTRPAAISCKIGPRDDDQASCIQKSVAFLKSGRDHIFEAPTGFGKTICGILIAAQIGQATLILVTKEDLMNGWKLDLLKAGVPADKIGHVQQNKCDYQDKWFVLAMVHSFVGNSSYPEELYGYFGLVIFDETHKMAADTFVKACHRVRAKMRLGLSATPTRKDGKTLMLHQHIGPILVRGKLVPMKAKILVKKTGWKIPRKSKVVNGEWKHVPLHHGPGRMMLVNAALAADPIRNKIITDFVVSCLKSGRQVLMVSDMIDKGLVPMFHLLAKAGVPGEDIGYYISGKKPHELVSAAGKRVILATYGMVAEGTNYPDWDSLVPMNPRADIKQTLGRILRSKPDKKQPVMLDLVDGDSIFHGFYGSREKQYYEVQAEIVKL